MDFSLI